MVFWLISAIPNPDVPNTVQICHRKLEILPKFTLNDPSSVNIGQTDLLFCAQIDVHQRSTYHHRPLGCDQSVQMCHQSLQKTQKNRQKYALDDSRSP